jgi:hypothetical protein
MVRCQQALEDLRFHWGEAYEISYRSPWWQAVRRDTGSDLLASEPRELRNLIIVDYSCNPVLRYGLVALTFGDRHVSRVSSLCPSGCAG